MQDNEEQEEGKRCLSARAVSLREEVGLDSPLPALFYGADIPYISIYISVYLHMHMHIYNMLTHLNYMHF